MPGSARGLVAAATKILVVAETGAVVMPPCRIPPVFAIPVSAVGVTLADMDAHAGQANIHFDTDLGRRYRYAGNRPDRTEQRDSQQALRHVISPQIPPASAGIGVHGAPCRTPAQSLPEVKGLVRRPCLGFGRRYR